MDYIKEAGYEHINKSTGDAQFYRFTAPKSKEYPFMIKIFSRNPEYILLGEDAEYYDISVYNNYMGYQERYSEEFEKCGDECNLEKIKAQMDYDIAM